jgi:hypothetical protein
MQAMHEYKQSSGRMFPTWSEVLEVLRSLGYEKPRSPVSSGNGHVLPARAIAKAKPAKRA